MCSYTQQVLDNTEEQFPTKCPQCTDELICCHYVYPNHLVPVYICSCGYKRIVKNPEDFVVFTVLCYEQIKNKGLGLTKH